MTMKSHHFSSWAVGGVAVTIGSVGIGSVPSGVEATAQQTIELGQQAGRHRRRKHASAPVSVTTTIHTNMLTPRQARTILRSPQVKGKSIGIQGNLAIE